MKNDEALRLLGEIAELLRDLDSPPIVIGGLAVHLTRQIALSDVPEWDAPETRDLTDPLRLAALIRITRDVDIVIQEDEAVRVDSALSTAGMRVDERVRLLPIRYHGDAIWVDVIKRSASGDRVQDLGPLVTWLETVLPAMPCGVGRVLLPPLAALVVLKAVAYTDRHAQHDLADIATLALLDLREGVGERALAALVPLSPREIARCLRHVRDVFRAGAFIRELDLVGLTLDEEREAVVVALVSEAVAKLLRSV